MFCKTRCCHGGEYICCDDCLIRLIGRCTVPCNNVKKGCVKGCEDLCKNEKESIESTGSILRRKRA